MDFSAWHEVYLGGRWWAMDGRHNIPRIGRILMATGRDAVDVALTTQFGSAWLSNFQVITHEAATPPSAAWEAPAAGRPRARPGIEADGGRRDPDGNYAGASGGSRLAAHAN